MKKRYTTLCCLFLMALGTFSYAAPAAQQGGKVPTNIKSSRMDYNADAQTVVFSGKVHVTRPDFQLWSEKLTVYLEKSKQSSKEGAVGGMQAGDIDRIVAEKNVIIKSEDKEARSEKATYTAKKDEFKLEGSPWLKDKDNTIRGHTIYHYLSENKSVVSGSVDVNFSAPDQTLKK